MSLKNNGTNALGEHPKAIFYKARDMTIYTEPLYAQTGAGIAG